jgi:hypothetical protein
MTTRTVKMFGLAYGPTPAEITVTLDGVSVYTGTVTTADEPVPSLPNIELVDTTVEFCNFEIPMEFSGAKPMTCTVNSGTVIFADILANYVVADNTDPVAGSGPDQFFGIDGAGNARSSVFIDGVEQPMNHEEFGGSWWFKVSEGSTLSYNLDIQAGTPNIYVPPEPPPTPPTEEPAPE